VTNPAANATEINKYSMKIFQYFHTTPKNNLEKEGISIVYNPAIQYI
jgi:hypothetical protein